MRNPNDALTFPLSEAQRSRWFLYQMDPTAQGRHNNAFCARVNGNLKPDDLSRSLNLLIERHPMLRAGFSSFKGEAFYRIAQHAKISVNVYDAVNWSGEKLQQQVNTECLHIFDLAQPPLVLANWYQCKEQNAVMLLVFNHIVVDGWSYWLLLEELGELLSSNPLPPVADPSYEDYVQWQQTWLDSPRAKSQQQFWQQELQGELPILQLPAKSNSQQPRQGTIGVPYFLPSDLVAKLQVMAKKQGGSLFPIMLSAYQLLLHRYTGLEDIIIGSIVPGRSHHRWGKLVGEFINSIALRCHLDHTLSVSEHIQRASRLIRQGIEHQYYPFSKVVEQLNLARDLKTAPVFQTAMTFHKARYLGDLLSLWGPDDPSPPVHWGGSQLRPFPYKKVAEGDERVPLTLQILECDDWIVTGFCYDPADFDRETIDQLAAHFFTLLSAMEQDESKTVNALPLLSAAEQHHLLVDFNKTAATSPPPDLIHQLFEQQVERAPDAIALVHQGASLSYDQLNRQANRLAHYLMELGVQPDDRVGVCIERSLEMVVGLLAILKAGGAYLPLDPHSPRDRLVYLLEDSQPVAVLTQRAWRDRLPAQTVPVVVLDDQPDQAAIARQVASNPETGQRGLTPQHLAYVMYTSGSTGLPKGVMVEHHSVVHLIHNTYAPITAEDCLAHCANIAFDAATWELWGALLKGASVCLIAEDTLLNPAAFQQALLTGKVTALFLTTALFNQYARLLTPVWSTLKYLLFGGEHARVEPVAYLFQHHRPAHLVHVYGPTETTTFATAYQVDAVQVDQRSIPIGAPIAHSRIYLLDAARRPVPIGVSGEIYIGGAGVARGYLNRPDLTAERFLPDPFSRQPNARMYRTGDLGRWLPDGNIEYLGRNDSQVKIRGFRIELGEIEARLRAIAGVADGVVIAREDVTGDKRLVAYLVSGDNGLPAVARLREQLSRHLAEYMLPSAFVTLDALPLTANGKLDRQALPAPDHSTLTTREYQAPQGRVEEAIARIWQELLGLERVGRHDHFFELGGHSLLVVSMIEHLHQDGWSLDVKVAFSTPILAAMAQQVKTSQTDQVAQTSLPDNLIPAECTAITPEMLPLVTLQQQDINQLVAQAPGGAANIQDIYPLSPLQAGMVFHHYLETTGDIYLNRAMLALQNRAHLDAFLAALQQVIDRHDILRSAVSGPALAEPVQIVYRQAQLPVTTPILTAEGDIAQQLYDHADPRTVRLDITRAPLLSASIAEDPATGQWLLVLLQHHLVCDHVTLALIIDEIGYFLRGESERLPAALPYRHFIAQVMSVPLAEHEAYFCQQLGQVDHPTLPFELQAVQKAGEPIAEAQLTLAPSLAQAVRECARQQGVNTAVLFHVVWAQVLAQCSGQDEVVFGTVLSGRLQGMSGADRALGLFINTLPLRVSLAGRSVGQVLQETYQRLSELLVHEQASLALAQRCSGVKAPLPLFNSLLNYRHSQNHVDTSGFSTWQGIRILRSEERTGYPLTLNIDDTGQGFTLTTQCNPRVDPARINAYVQTALSGLVEWLRTDVQDALLHLNILPSSEREQVLKIFNDTSVAYPQTLLVHQLFEQQAARSPQAVALVHQGVSLSYGQLNHRANQLAHDLISKGVQPDTRVGICVERSLEMVVGLLAILKAGGGYVPLDPTYPAERIAYILQDSQPTVLLTQHRLLADLPLHTVPVVVIDDQADSAVRGQQPNANPAVHLRGLLPHHLAYVIYTSGSTGSPKGVAITHHNVVNFLLWAKQTFALEQIQRTLFSTSINFDLSVYECLAPLSIGGCVELVDDIPSLLTTPPQVSLINTVPSAISMLLEAQAIPPSVQVVNLAGEELRRERVERIFSTTSVNQVNNLYGPSETTIYSTWSQMDRRTGFVTHIGKPLTNTQVYLLTPHGDPVPIGVIGEIYIGGAGVARGYINRPDLTAERFLPDPFSRQPNARMYRTGDLGRWLPDGNIEYLGRNDSQVKIRGFRIELGEIEARLRAIAGVADCVVIAREDVIGDQRLVAYLVSGDNGLPAVALLREQLSRHLAEYMLPSAFVTLDALPLTPNGKLDRQALPAPDHSALATREYQAPQGRVEEAIARIWQALFGLAQVGRHDNFFELGGHSLLAVQLIARLRQTLGIDITLQDLFSHPGLKDLAEVATQATAAIPPAILPADRQHPLPLSWAQQRLWFLHRLDQAASAAYHISAALRLQGTLNCPALHAALDRIVARHQVLRTTFTEQEGEVRQVIASADCGCALWQDDLRPLTGQALQSAIEQRCREEAQTVFDLARGPLIRGQLLRTAEDQHILLVTQHHIISDGWSIGILIRELTTLYRAFSQGQPDPLPPLALHYADYAVWQRQWLQGDVLAQQRAYWREALADAPTLLMLPVDHPRPLIQRYQGGQVNLAWPAALSRQLQAFSQQQGVTLFMSLLAGWSILLSRISGQTDLVVGTPVANRQHPELEPLMGFFVNTLALRVRLEDNPRVETLLTRIKSSALAAYAHQDLPFEQLVEVLQPPRSLGHHPIFQVMLTLDNTPRDQPLALPGIAVSYLDHPGTTTQFDLTLSLTETEQGLTGVLVYASDLFEPATIERMADYLQRILTSMVADAHQRVSEIPLLSPAEQQQLLVDFNDTATAYPQAGLLHQLFEQQAERAPDAIALVHQDTSLSYGELNRRANRLAHYLIELGVQPDHRVGLCIEPGLEMIVALLAILKAGGGYVPLDPHYPADRLAYLLADSQPVILLTQHAWQDRLTEQAVPLLVLDRDQALALIGQQPAADPHRHQHGLTPQHLAYVIYTSGSTGLPKGVMVEHRNVTSLLAATDAQFGFHADDVWTLFHSFSFDFSVWEIWGALAYGGRLVIVPAFSARSPNDVYALLCQQGVTVLNQTPSAFRQLITAQVDSPLQHRLRKIIFGGEALAFDTLLPWVQNNDLEQTRLINMYGITETTVHVTYRQIDLADITAGQGSVIGRTISGLRAYLLDPQGQPVPIGVTGELYISGAGVARGYLNRPELTAERFLPDPFNQQPNARMYRTGDLGRWLPDGTIEYLGRNDGQVKIRGFRIELGEIEARLRAIAGVADGVVIPRQTAAGDQQLVAYLVAQADAILTVSELREQLGRSLPDYMLPAAFVTLDTLPLTANGKLDRQALPAAQDADLLRTAYQAPQGEVEQQLAEIWQQLLGLERVGRHDNFFDLGGHSLLAVQLQTAIRQRFEVELSIHQLFLSPTIDLCQECIVDAQLRQYDPASLQAIYQSISDTEL